jgi:curli biogenesis system outer membrane secretion channel CsgG
MRSALLRGIVSMGLCASLIAVAGCASSGETAEADKLTANVGVYPPGPSGVEKPTLGVPVFDVKYSEGSEKKLERLAADQMSSLMFLTRRFTMVERAQMDKALGEQGLEGIVKPAELAKAGQMSGARFLVVGKVTNLRVKAETTKTGFGLAKIPLIGVGGFDYKKKDSRITAECGVDLRIIDSTSGQMMAAHFGEFKRTDSIGAIGIEVLGASATADADLKISDDDKGKILRLALDEAVKKMLGDIDAALTKMPAAGGTPTVAPPTNGGGAATPVANKFCPKCGKPVPAAATFSPCCGEKMN